MRKKRVWGRLLGLERAVVEEVEISDEGQVVVAVRPRHRERDRCGSAGADRRALTSERGGGAGGRSTSAAPSPTWRPTPRGCLAPATGWSSARCPSARHGWRFTRAFEDQLAWLAVKTSKSAVAELMRVAWRSVGRVCERVAAEAGRDLDLLAGLRRIGIDEISRPGRETKTVEAFFDALGEKRCRRLELVSCDIAGWISGPIAERCPRAKRCVDPFHVIALATDALDQIRREVWNQARGQGQGAVAAELKGARFGLWKNPENLSFRQRTKLADVERLNRPLYRAYLLKEQLRQIYRLPARQALALLEQWLAWAQRCRLGPFVKLARTITEQREGIVPRSATASPTPAWRRSTPRSG